MFLKIYLIGVLVSFLVSLLIEQFYYGNGKSITVKLKSILENLLYSLLSWIGVVGEMVFFLGEWYTDFSEKGYGEFIHDYEEKLKEEEEKKNATED